MLENQGFDCKLGRKLVLFRCGKVNQNYMKHKELYLSLLLILFFGLDAFYWYGDLNNIEFITHNSIVWFVIPFIGFNSLLFFNKGSLKNKIIFNILISLGILLNAFLIGAWYVLKDFGF